MNDLNKSRRKLATMKILDAYRDAEYIEIDEKRVRKVIQHFFIDNLPEWKGKIRIGELAKAIATEFKKDRYEARDKALREIEELEGNT